MNEIITRIVDAPVEFKGCVKLDCNGDINLYINGRLSEEEKQRVLEHETRHIEYGHLWDDTLSVEEKEFEAENGREKVRTGDLHT